MGRNEKLGVEARSIAADTPSVLIAPLEAMGSLDEIDELASGITAQLIADLMRFNSFRLYDYTQSLSWKESDSNPETGNPLEADFVVRGVVRGDEDKVSIVVRLIDSSDGEVFWSDSFSGQLSANAISDMQAELAGKIAAKLGEPYGVLRKSLMPEASPGVATMTSFGCVMQAYAYRHTNKAENYPSVRACLEEAVLQDPDYAEAWAMLAVLRLDGGRFGYDGPTAEVKERAYASARAAANRALALESENVAATSALAMIAHYSGLFDESLEYSRRSVQLNPNDPSILGYHGWRLVARGHYDEGLAYIQKAIERSANPVPMLFHMIAVERLMQGDMEGMLAAAERASVDSSSVSDAFLAIAYGGLGRSNDAAIALERMATKWPLLAKDPGAAFGWHNLHPEIIDAIVAGLRGAGWEPPESLAMDPEKP
jgi:TolB-like protein